MWKSPDSYREQLIELRAELREELEALDPDRDESWAEITLRERIEALDYYIELHRAS